MRILFIADGRSRTTLSWLNYWVGKDYEVHFISTFPCNSPPGVTTFNIIPVAFSRLAGKEIGSQDKNNGRAYVKRFRGFLRSLRNFLGPFSLPSYWIIYGRLLRRIQPDLVHALRIPYEGMLASFTPQNIPLVVSIWGNDLTLHTRGLTLMGFLTRKVLRRADGLMADASRDIRLSRKWSYSEKKPTLIVPGAGGIKLGNIKIDYKDYSLPEKLPHVPIIVNPRGQRVGSLRQDNFFKAIPLVLKKHPDALFVCPILKGDEQAEKWVRELNIYSNTRLWPVLDQAQLWKLYKQAQIFVSPSIHDGTPNSLLEAMACGCFPVVGNIESMREWIQDGVNGCLVNADSLQSIANGIISALGSPSLRKAAAKQNARLVFERAEQGQSMTRAEAFYKNVIINKTQNGLGNI
jgi:glycosyltransferase involved in cell wall biosynthesis